MTVVAHVGPPIAATGGPAGYLAQLSAAFEGHRSAYEVLFPARATPAAAAPVASSWRSMAHRLRSALLGMPRYYRPDPDSIRREGDVLASLFTASLAGMRDANAASLANARAHGADVLFAHDLAGAEAALSARSGAEVWMMLHAPMPLGLYMAWSWAVPELEWRDILTLPDVRALVDRELDVCRRVERIILPAPEALDELVRCDARFESLRSRVSYVMTGARRSAAAPSLPKSDARARFGLPLDQPIGVFVGNNEPYRGLDRLVAGLDAMDDPRVVPGCLAVAGPDPRRLAGNRRIRALGRVNDVPLLLTAVDFVVNVNQFSLFDLSIIEALEAGKPLLMHATGGNRTFARLGAGCEMLPDLEAGSIAAALERMFTLPAPALATMSGRSRACYDAHLTPDAFRLAHERLYETARSTMSM
jgi:glycosyltransferase involved in cell wall biosynthesis